MGPASFSRSSSGTYRSADPDVTGNPVTLYVFTKAFRDAVVKAALYAVAFIVIFLAVTLRSPVSVLAALAPLVMGTLWTLGLMHVFGIDLNLANTIFMPWWWERASSTVSLLSRGGGRAADRAGLQPSRKHRYGCGPRRALDNGRLLQPDDIRAPGNHSSLGLLTTIGALCVLGRQCSFYLPSCMRRRACGPGRETARLKAKKTMKPTSRRK